MKNRRVSIGPVGAVALALLAALQPSCVTTEKNPNVVSTYSDKLSTFNYKEEGTIVRLVVGVDAARLIRKEPYFPLFVQVVNKSKATFTVTTESFFLEDNLGNQYPMAPPREVLDKYHRMDLDRRLFRQNRSITLNGVGVFTAIRSDFFPSTSRSTVRIDQVEMPPTTYLDDVVYFPIPQAGLNGVPLRLFFKVKEMAEAVHVVFEVPRILGALEKEDDMKDEETP